MNLHLSSRFAASVLPLLAACALLPGLNSTAAAAEVNAIFNSAATVPVTAASYTATGDTVSFTLNFAPPTGTNLTVVKNTGLGLIDGTFDNLAQGQAVSLTYGGISYPFVANYFGGTGNDLVLQWANRRLMSWGYNAQGQLGNQSTTQSTVPVPVLMSGVLADKAILTAAMGTSHSLALASDGTLTAWGYNVFGQLGNSGSADSNVPTLVTQTGVLAGKRLIAVAAKTLHSVALATDGTVATWGYNANGELGNNTTTSWSIAPVLVDRTGALAGKTVVALAAGGNFNLALCADGSLVGWGNNGAGQFGNGTTTSSGVPVAIPLTGVLAGKAVVAIAAGYDHSLALCADGTLAAWGNNTYGQLGNNTTTSSSVPVAVVKTGVLAGKSVTAIDLGELHSMCLCTDGTVVTWGYNNAGQLGNNSTTNRSVPVLVTKTGVLAGRTPVAVRAGVSSSFALCADGSVATWGDNTYGQLGNNSTTQSTVPVLANTSNFRSGERFMALPAGTGTTNSLAITALPPPPIATTLAASGVGDTGAVLNGSVSANGNATTVSFEYGLTAAYGTTVAATPSALTGTTTTAVSATLAELPPGTTYHYRVIASNPNGVMKGADMTFTTSAVASLAGLTLDPGTMVPGFDPQISRYDVTLPNTAGNLRVSPVAEDPAALVTVNGVAVAAGAAVNIALAEGMNTVAVVVTAADGIITHTYTIKVMRWPATYVFKAATDVPAALGGCVASGSTATLALGFAPAVGTELTVVKNTGTARIQGVYDNLPQGQLVSLPYNGARYKFVVDYFGGTGNDLVLRWAYTKIYAWGNNSSGVYGRGNNLSESVPTAVGPAGILAGKTVTALGLGSDHTLALCADGTLAAWGYGSSGQLGNGSTTGPYNPVAVTTTGVLAGKRVVAIATCNNHNLVLCSDGTLASWGENLSGQLGDGTTTRSTVPVLVSTDGVLAGRTVVAIAAGPSHCLALCSDGTLAAWGSNGLGQLGDGTTTARKVPVAVDRSGFLAGKTVTAISAGAISMALCSDGTIASWGTGWSGNLGNGSTINSNVPIAVNTTGVLAGKTVSAIVSGYNCNLALCTDRTLVAWGYNGMGGHGNGTYTDSNFPVLVNSSGVLAGKIPIAIAESFPCYVLCADGTVAAWGDNQRYQFGNGTSNGSNVPVAASLTNLGAGEKFTSLALGSTAVHSMAIAAVPLSGNSKLSGFALTGAVLDPAFDAAVTTYTARLAPGGSTVAVTPTAADAMSTITVNGNAVNSGVAGETITAPPGSTLSVRVTAENGTSTTYAINVRRDASLASLGLSQGALLPAFSPFVRDYSVSVGAATASLVVTPVAADPTAAVTVNGTPTVGQGVALPLVYGANPVAVKVTALDGTVIAYQMTVTRAAPVNFTYTSATAVPLTVPAYVATDNTANLVLGYAPATGTNLMVVNNTGNDPIDGRFANLSHGQLLKMGYNGVTYSLVANYYGGTGNDLVLQWANTVPYGWGENTNGQVGNGGRFNSSAAEPVTMPAALQGKAILALATGRSHSLALAADGTLAAWGANAQGQLGNDTTDDASTPVIITGSGVLAGRRVVAIAAGGEHSIALCEDGTLAAWGANSSGQLGNGGKAASSVPVAVKRSGVLAGKTVMALSAGGWHTLAFCSDGTVAAWGSNASGQLGIGSNTASLVPARVMFGGTLASKRVAEVGAGREFSVARFTDGSLASWGAAYLYQLGDGTTTARQVPTPIPQTGAFAGKSVSRLAVGTEHSLALCSDGTMVAWGRSESGRLGNGAWVTVPALVSTAGVLGGKTITDFAAGYSHSLALCSDGTLAFWGRITGGTGEVATPTAVPLSPLAGNKVTALAKGGIGDYAMFLACAPTGTNAALASLAVEGGLLDALFSPAATTYGVWVTPESATIRVVPLAADPNATVAVNGLVVARGAASEPIAVVPGTAIAVRVTAQNGAAVTHYALAVRNNASLAGLSIGSGMLEPAFSPAIRTYQAVVPAATAEVALTATAGAPEATLTVNGKAAVSGQASNPVSLVPGSNAIPVVVAGAGGSSETYTVTVIRQVPLSHTFSSAASVARTSAGYMAAGNTAQFSLGFAPPTGTALRVINNTGNDFINGEFDNLAHGQRVELTYNGITYPFVANYFGGTGNDLVLQWANVRVVAWGAITGGGPVPTPVAAPGVLAGKTVTAVAVGQYHCLALCSDGTLAAWGHNSIGELGNGTNYTDEPVPVAVSGSALVGRKVVAIAAGDAFSMALCADGTVTYWGRFFYNYTASFQGVVPTVLPLSGVLAGRKPVGIAIGAGCFFVRCADGTVVGYGNNDSGILGNNSTMDAVGISPNDRGALAGKPVSLLAASGHCLATTATGGLLAWGENASGQLGDGTTAVSLVPVAVNTAGVLAGKTPSQIAAGSNFSLVNCTDGTLAAWGSNIYGELGRGTTGSSNLPVLVVRTGVLSGKTVSGFFAGSNHALATCTDGTVAAWGYNASGQLGDNSTTNRNAPVLVNTTGLVGGERFVGVCAGNQRSLAITALPLAPLATTSAASEVKDASATINGSVSGQGSATSVSFEYGPTTAYGSTVAAVPGTVSGSAATAVKAVISGLISGATYHFRLIANGPGGVVRGEDQTFDTTTLANLSALALEGAEVMPALVPSRSNYVATVPYATTQTRVTPTCADSGATVTVNGTAVISGAASEPVALSVGNTAIPVVVSGTGGNSRTYTVTVTRLPETFVFATAGSVPVTAAEFVAAGDAPAIGLGHTPQPGATLTLVNNTGGNPIMGSFANLRQGQVVNLTYGGMTYPFAVNYAGGTGNDLVLQWTAMRLMSWGGNYPDWNATGNRGQLGNGTNVNSPVPVAVDLAGVLAGKVIVARAVGGSHNLVLCADGTLVSWGWNHYGQLGDGTSNYNGSSNTPLVVIREGDFAGRMVTAIAAGEDHSMALCSDGALFVWGDNWGGQLGDGSTTTRSKPIRIDGNGVLAGRRITAIWAGNNNSFALCADGVLTAWGYNNAGQLGDGTANSRTLPVKVNQTGVLVGKTIRALSGARYGNHTLALCTDGTLAAWGDNTYGQLGNANTTASTVPALVSRTGALSGKTVIGIAAGYQHSLAVCADGTLAAWGLNANGELGDGTTTNRTSPVAITGKGSLVGKTVVAVSAGYDFSAVRCSDNTLAAWGNNQSGQLGNGTTTNSTLPVPAGSGAALAGERVVGLAAGFGHGLVLVASVVPPAVTPLAASGITDSGATLNGAVNANGTASTVAFEYGTTTTYLTTVAAAPPSFGGVGATPVGAALSGLQSETIYHYRVVATNGMVTVRSEFRTFSTTGLATLASLTVDRGALMPVFSPRRLDYDVTVPFGTTTATVHAAASSPGAAVTVNGAPVMAGDSGVPVALAEGGNAVLVTVVSPDGSFSTGYTVNITRLPQSVRFTAAEQVGIDAGDLAPGSEPLAVELGFTPPVGTSLTLVRNRGTGPIRGFFAGLEQGATVHLGYGGMSYPFVVNYYGGSGNDLVLEWGNVRLVGWGYNGNWQLGAATPSSSSVPLGVRPTGALAGRMPLGAVASANSSLVLCADGTVAAWGYNGEGQLGNGTTVGSADPVAVLRNEVLEDKRVVAIPGMAVGTTHGLCDDGTVAAWGYNSYGQLGDGGTINALSPVNVAPAGALAGKRVMQTAGGLSHTLALCADGTVAAWGNNGYGKLGNGTTVASSVPVAVSTASVLSGKAVTAVSAGSNSSYALCADGTVAAWGYNTNGELGDGTTKEQSLPVAVSRTGALSGKTVTAIQAGAGHCLALCSDGSLVAWGGNAYGQLGDGSTTNRPTPIAVDRNGALAGKTVIAISAGESFSLAVCADGSVASWGRNNYGQLGDGTTTNRSAPVLVVSSSLAASERMIGADAGNLHVLARVAMPPPPVATTLAATEMTDSGATLRGQAAANGAGPATVAFEYGTSTAYGNTVAASPGSVEGADTASVSAQLTGLPPGTVFHYRVVATAIWGTAKGEDRTFATGSLSVLAGLATDHGGLTPAFFPAVGTYGLTVDNAVETISLTPVAAHAGVSITVAGEPVVSGSASSPIPLEVGSNALAVTVRPPGGGAGLTYTVTVVRMPAALVVNSLAEVPLVVSGIAPSGADASVVLGFAPVPGSSLMLIQNTGNDPIRGTFANLAHNQKLELTHAGVRYAFVADYQGGTGNDLVLRWADTRLVGWGTNEYGKLGIGSFGSSYPPGLVAMPAPLLGKTIKEISSGWGHTLVLFTDGTLAAFGYNGSGQIGNGTTDSVAAPVVVSQSGVLAGKTVSAVAAGWSHSLALCSDGTLAAWGYNLSGQLGNGSTTNSLVPVPVNRDGVLAGRTVTAIATRGESSLALCADGTLVAWGGNSSGQLGDGTQSSRSTPVMVDRSGALAGRRVVSIACGTSYGLALCDDGTLAAWGYNGDGALGDGTTTNRSVPVLVNTTGLLTGKTVAAITAGSNFSMALCTDGTLAAWGGNSYGQLGNNSTVNSSLPVRVELTGTLAGETVTGIMCGLGSTGYAITATGGIAAWGANDVRQLGNGTTTGSLVPVAVAIGPVVPGGRAIAMAGGPGFAQAVLAVPPEPFNPVAASTLAASGITDSSALLSGSVNAAGTAVTVSFEYGPTAAYGATSAAAPASVSGETNTPVSVRLDNLTAAATYHFRVVAIGPVGVSRGADQTFTTGNAATLAALGLSEGPLEPAFAPGTFAYASSVPNETAAITATPQATHSGAVIRVNGTVHASGEPTGPLALTPGENLIRIAVDAGDGVNTATYVVSVVRLPGEFAFNSADDIPLETGELAAGGLPVAIRLNFAPVPGTRLTLVNQTGTKPIRGGFSNLPDGGRVYLTFGGKSYDFIATYQGGDGNDLVLEWGATRVVGWGSAMNGATFGSPRPAPLAAEGALAGRNVVAMDAADTHGVACCLDGSVVTWGSNENGQLGNGASGGGAVPVEVNRSGVLAGKRVTAVSTGGYHDLALCSDGTLVAWGRNTEGALGVGNQPSSSRVPLQVDQTGVLAGKLPVSIAAGGNHSVVACADGTLAAWGRGGLAGNGDTAKAAIPVLVDRSGVLADKTPVAVSAGANHTLVLCADGTLAAWGSNESGQLGNATTAAATAPVGVNLTAVPAGSKVIAINAGNSHNLALCDDGTLLAWGENGNGQLGILGTTDQTTPVPVYRYGELDGRTVVAIAAGGAHSLALCEDGAMLAWGENSYYQLGFGNTIDYPVPTRVAAGAIGIGDRLVGIAAGYYSSVALVATSPSPVVLTMEADGISDSGATLRGSAGGNGSDVAVAFEYGTTTAYGNRIASVPAAVAADAASPVSAVIGGLKSGTTYHFRAIADYAGRTVRGEDRTFTTTTYGVLADLRLSGATLVPAFDPNVGDYLGMAPATVETIRVTPVAATGTPVITVNGIALASGAASEPIPLAPGENTIRVSVTAADGIQGKTYTLTLTRLPGEFVFHSLTDIPLTVGALGVAGAAPPFSLHQAPQPGTVLTVINNTGLRPITGTFDNLAQGQLVPLTYGTTTWFFAADYGGGTGNDLVLHWAGNRAFAWGANYAGQLGNGATTDSAVPVAVNASGVLANQTVVDLAAGASLAASYGHSLALCANGRVAAWGYNDHGQLGNGNTTASNVPVWVDPTGALAGKTVVAVSAGSGHSLALCSDGTIAAWGYNGYSGQLGNSDTTDSKVPVAVTTTGALAGKQVAAIAAGAYHNLALCSDGTLVSWGDGTALGNNSTAGYAPAPVPVDQSGVLAGKRVVAVSAGQHFSLVLCDDGTLAAWGNNATGVLGNGTTTNALVPVLVDRSGVLAGKTVVAIACGSLHALALCADGTLAAWGANDRGQLGNNSTVASPVPVRVDQTGVLAGKILAAIYANSASSMAMGADGTLAAWGDNYYGQLGDGSKTSRLVPTAMDSRALGSGGRYVMVGGGPSTAAHGLGLVAMPLPTASPLAVTGITGTDAILNGSVNALESAPTIAFEVGLDETYGTTVAASPDTVTGKKNTALAAAITDLKPGTTYHYRVVATSYGGIVRSADRTFTTLSDNALLADLSHDGGVIAPGFEKQRIDYLSSVPFETAAVTVSAVTDHPGATFTVNGAAGSVPIPITLGNNSISVVVTAEDGITTKTYTITVNRLPQEFVFNAATDVPVTSTGFAAGGNPVRMVLGFAPAPGTVLTMVNNTSLGFIYGRFGNLAQGQRVTLRFDGRNYDFIANYHGGTGNDLVLQWATTELLAWGGNGFGQLGDDTTTRRLVPTPVNAAGVLADKPVLAVAEGYLHSLALCADGTLAAWGYNAFGQLGNNGSATSLIPAAVDQTGALAGKTVVAIAAGPFHNLALCEDGTVVSWGYNNHGQLGDGTKVTRRAPVMVARVGALAGMQVVAVSAGAYQSFALGADGTVAAWGYNDEGELGDGTTNGSLVPVAVDRSGALAGKQVASLAAGQYHTLALCTDATLVAWGYNKTGQLGNNSTTAAASPVTVSGQAALAGMTPVGISAGSYHSLARCADGTVVAWGANNRGQLGVAAPGQSALPLAVDVTGVASGGGISALAAGGNHSLLRLADGRLAAWGENTNGQLGDDSLLSRALPTEVTALTGRIMAVASGAAAQHNLALQAMPMAQEVTLAVAAAGLTGVDLINYAFQLDPSRPGGAQLPEGRMVEGEYVVRFAQPAAVNDVVYGAEWSGTMQPGSWQEVPDTGSGSDHRFVIPATGAAQGFIRLKVTAAAR